ncbi:hypothetical protein V8D89_013056 [Ganoderma adspersum]
MAGAVLEDWVQSFRENNYLSVAAFTLLYYDYALTFTDEVNYFWKSASLSLFSTFFVINRYLGLIGTIPIIVEYFVDLPETSCRRLQLYHQFFSMVIQGLIASMLLLRTYALYERNKAILALLVITFVGAAIASLAAMLPISGTKYATSTMPEWDPPNQCDLSLTVARGIRFSIGWGAMLWFDTAVFLLTLVRALRTHDRLSGGILEVLLRDGTIYFGIMVGLNVSNIVTFLAIPVGSKKGMETALVNVLSTTLASRLFLNLRDLASPHSQRHGHEESNVSKRWGPNNTVRTISFLVFATQSGGSTGFDATGPGSVNDPDV